MEMGGSSVAAAIDKRKGGRGGRETPCPGGREGAGAAPVVPAAVGETDCRGGGATAAGVGEDGRRRIYGLVGYGQSATRPGGQPCSAGLHCCRHHRTSNSKPDSAAEDGIRPRSAGSAVQRTAAGTTAVQCRIRPRSSSWDPPAQQQPGAGEPPAQQLVALGTSGLCHLGTWGCACAVAGRRGVGRRDPKRPGRFTKSPRRRKTATRVTRLGFLWGLDWPTGSLGLWELDLDGRTGLYAPVAVTLGWQWQMARWAGFIITRGLSRG
jgi:hypothetical protein